MNCGFQNFMKRIFLKYFIYRKNKKNKKNCLLYQKGFTFYSHG